MGHGACTEKIALFLFFPTYPSYCTFPSAAVALAVPLALIVSKSFVGVHAASTGSTVQRIQLTKVAQYDNTISCVIHLHWENWGKDNEAVQRKTFHVNLSGCFSAWQESTVGRCVQRR
jgi:hypothetical protein